MVFVRVSVSIILMVEQARRAVWLLVLMFLCDTLGSIRTVSRR